MNKSAVPLFLVFFCYLFFIGQLTMAQEQERQMVEEPPKKNNTKVKRSAFRAILNKVSLGVSTGYGLTFYRQNLSGYSVLRRGDEHFLYNEPLQLGNPASGYQYWINKPLLNNTIIPTEQDAIVNGDTTELKLNGFGHSLPLSLTLHVQFFEKFRIGGGVTGELHSVGPLKFNAYQDVLGEYQPKVNSAFFLRYYGLVGYKAGFYYNYDFVVDAQIGKKKYITQFDKSLLSNGLFANLGVSIEKNYSEYFRVTIRPSLEWQTYKMELPAYNNQLTTKTPAFFIQGGISLNYPLLPRCPIDGCQTQLEHVHFGKEYRGQPIYNWQNPKYGQNHPELMMNKRKYRKNNREKEYDNSKNKRNKFLFWKKN